MLHTGDRVIHNTFPPVTGTVAGAQPMLQGPPKIAVMNDATGTLFYDFENTWDLITSSYMYADADSEHYYVQTLKQIPDVVDVEFEVIE